MKRESKYYLEDIIEAIDKIEEYTENNYEIFNSKRLIIDAVLRNLEIIGEAVSQIDETIKTSHPNLPWRDIKDFRNVVAHKYFKINKNPNRSKLRGIPVIFSLHMSSQSMQVSGY